MEEIPKEVQKIVEKRDELRKNGKYEESDALRKKLEGLGYEVTDGEDRTEIMRKDLYSAPERSFLVLFGSGEIAPSGVRAHERVLEGIGKKDVSIAVISTPAGFQPNVQVVYEEIAEFFEKHLANYHPRIAIVYANTLEDANNPALVQMLATADYIFTGPGSPTYAVQHLKDSLIYKKIVERVEHGASLGLASAAAIAFSRFALPVYEIYKVGAPLYWEDGLNLYEKVLREITIVPHFNNTEGGKKNDTSRAWMGKERFEKLRTLLPHGHEVWGIDEHTAALIDLQTKKVESIGKGSIMSA
jgi:cyanophycinase-like exopeptidase